MQQGIKFTEGLTWMAWFLLVLWFNITHKVKHTQDKQGPIIVSLEFTTPFSTPFLSSHSFLKYFQPPIKDYQKLTSFSSSLPPPSSRRFLVQTPLGVCLGLSTQPRYGAPMLSVTFGSNLSKLSNITTHTEKDNFRKGLLVLVSDNLFGPVS